MAFICLDAWGMVGEPSGVSRYCRGLIPELVAQAPEHEFVVLRPTPKPAYAQPIVSSASVRELIVTHRPSDLAYVLSSPVLGRVFRRHGRPDLFHSLFHLLPLGLRRGRFAPRRVVVTLHDTIWIDYAHLVERNWIAAEARRQFSRRVIPYALRTADHVMCNSVATAERASEWVSPDRTTTVHHGVETEFFQPAPPPSPALPALIREGRPYVAAFGVPKAYKNIQCLVRAFGKAHAENPRLRLVLIGNDGGVASLVREMDARAQVTVTGRLGDADLRSVVGHARLFVVPSLAEGFGLPALEAMALGTPVAVADIAALREVAGEAAMRFDPHEPGQLAEIIRRVAEDDELWRSLQKAGRRRASGFQWSITASRTKVIYDRLLASGRSGA